MNHLKRAQQQRQQAQLARNSALKSSVTSTNNTSTDIPDIVIESGADMENYTSEEHIAGFDSDDFMMNLEGGNLQPGGEEDENEVYADSYFYSSQSNTAGGKNGGVQNSSGVNVDFEHDLSVYDDHEAGLSPRGTGAIVGGKAGRRGMGAAAAVGKRGVAPARGNVRGGQSRTGRVNAGAAGGNGPELGTGNCTVM